MSRRHAALASTIAVVAIVGVLAAAGFSGPSPRKASTGPSSVRRRISSAKGAPEVTLLAAPVVDRVPSASAGGVTVVGTGAVEGAPDLLTISLGVQVHESSAERALSEANRQAAAVVSVLKNRGVADKDVQTNSVSLSPAYRNDGGGIDGYQAEETVTARIRDLTHAGSIIDEAAKAAGNSARIESLSFSIEDTSALMAAARQKAVKAAQAHARQLAEAAGAHLGAVRSIDETNEAQPVIMGGARGVPAMAAAGAASAAALPIQPGVQPLSVTVTVVYDLVP
ncbi:MAG: SIMPL domain-containing protein [Acidimicrobiales bacterium]